MKPKPVIDFGRLAELIEKVEGVFKAEGLNLSEKQLLMKSLNERIAAQVQKQRTEDMMQSMSGGGLMAMAKRMMNSSGD